MDPTYKYRAWYKAFTRIEIGYLVTPKTDTGNYVIEKTGDITVYAGESVVFKPGFHAQNGSKFHAFIKQDCKQPPENVPVYSNLQEQENQIFEEYLLAANDSSFSEKSFTNDNPSLSENYIQVLHKDLPTPIMKNFLMNQIAMIVHVGLHLEMMKNLKIYV